jgi:hypothetical protein
MLATPDHRSKSALFRLLGRSLIGIFCVSVLAAALPVQIRSADWGIGLSNRITDNMVLALAGVGLLRYAAFNDIQSSDDLDEDDEEIVDQKMQASRILARLGIVSVVAVALWQFILFFGILSSIDQQSDGAVNQIRQRTIQVKQILNKAPDSDIQRLLQQSRQALGNRARPPSTDPRRELADNIKVKELETIRQTYASAGQTRFRLARDSARVVLLCLIYAIAFSGLATLF